MAIFIAGLIVSVVIAGLITVLFDVNSDTALNIGIGIVVAIAIVIVIYATVSGFSELSKEDKMKETELQNLRSTYKNLTYKGTLGKCTFYIEDNNLICIHADCKQQEKATSECFIIEPGTHYHIYYQTGFSKQIQEARDFNENAKLHAVAGFLNVGIISDYSCSTSSNDNCVIFIGIALYFPNGETALIELKSGVFKPDEKLRTEIKEFHNSFGTMVSINGLIRDDNVEI